MRRGARFEHGLGALLLAAPLLLTQPVRAQEPAPPAAWAEPLRLSQAVIGRPLDAALAQVPLVDAEGRTLRLADFRGRPLVVSFVYTGCFQACPLATQGLARAVGAARQALGDDGFRVLTIGFNQPFDTPQALAAFARQHRVGDEGWSLVSPRAQDVAGLARAFGFSYQPTAGGFDHVTQATIVDARGVVYRQVYGDMPELPQFVGGLKALLSGEVVAPDVPAPSLWTRVKLYCTVYDPASGAYRLNYSLFVEIFCGATVLVALGWLIMREWRHARTR